MGDKMKAFLRIRLNENERFIEELIETVTDQLEMMEDGQIEPKHFLLSNIDYERKAGEPINVDNYWKLNIFGKSKIEDFLEHLKNDSKYSHIYNSAVNLQTEIDKMLSDNKNRYNFPIKKNCSSIPKEDYEQLEKQLLSDLKSGKITEEDIQKSTEVLSEIKATLDKRRGIDENGNIVVIQAENEIYKVARKTEEIKSYEVYKKIIDIGKSLEQLISENKDNANIDLDILKLNQRDLFYKYVLNLIMKDIDTFEIYLSEIIYLMTLYGFIHTERIEDFDGMCKVLNFLYYCYVFYEIFYLYWSIIGGNENTETTLYILFNKQQSMSLDRYAYIEEMLEILSVQLNSPIDVKSEFDNEGFRYNIYLVFDNALALALYELRLQLTDNADTTFAICKNPHCLNTFDRTTRKSEFCEDYECGLSRDNQRKKDNL